MAASLFRGSVARACVIVLLAVPASRCCTDAPRWGRPAPAGHGGRGDRPVPERGAEGLGHPRCRGRGHPRRPGADGAWLRARLHRGGGDRRLAVPHRLAQQVVHRARGDAARRRRAAAPGRPGPGPSAGVPAGRPARRPDHRPRAARPHLGAHRRGGARAQPTPTENHDRGDDQPAVRPAGLDARDDVELPQPELPGRRPPGRGGQR